MTKNVVAALLLLAAACASVSHQHPSTSAASPEATEAPVLKDIASLALETSGGADAGTPHDLGTPNAAPGGHHHGH